MPDAPPAKPRNPFKTFFIALAVTALIFVMFDTTTRERVGDSLAFVLTPLIGFNYKHPVWTLLFAGLIMVSLSTIIRHFLVDWVAMARSQESMRTFQKEFADARKSNNTYKIKRLTELQPEVMKVQAEMSGQQMKPMLFTMLIVIPIFLWLTNFIANAEARNPTALFAQMPWLPTEPTGYPLTGHWWFLPHWILLYSLFSIPVGQVLQRALKLWEFRTKAAEEGFTAEDVG